MNKILSMSLLAAAIAVAGCRKEEAAKIDGTANTGGVVKIGHAAPFK